MSEKPHLGRIDHWWKQASSDGRYIVRGLFVDHPWFSGEHGHTSFVLSHDEETGEIETRNSRYTLLKPAVSAAA